MHKQLFTKTRRSFLSDFLRLPALAVVAMPIDKGDRIFQFDFESTDIREFGASTTANDNGPALKEAILLGNGIVKIPKGNWRISSCVDIVIPRDTRIIGDTGARLIFENTIKILPEGPTLWAKGKLAFSGASTCIDESGEIVYALSKDAQRGNSSVHLNTVECVNEGDLIYFIEMIDGGAESGWKNYHPAHLTKVLSIDAADSSLALSDSLNFPFSMDGNTKIRISRSQFSLTIENLILKDDPDPATNKPSSLCSSAVSAFNSSLVFQMMKNVTLRSITQKNDDNVKKSNVMFSWCQDCQIIDSKIIGGLYPYQANTCRNIIFDSIEAEDSIHVVVPAVWSDNITIKNLTAKNCLGALEAHPSFNVSYIDTMVKDKKGRYSNLRVAGGYIKNSSLQIFDPNPDPKTGGQTSFHDIRFTPQFASINNEYDFTVDELLHDQNVPFKIWKGRNITLKNSEFRNGIIIHDGVQNLTIENCQYSSLNLDYATSLTTLRVNNVSQDFHSNGLYITTVPLTEGK